MEPTTRNRLSALVQAVAPRLDSPGFRGRSLVLKRHHPALLHFIDFQPSRQEAGRFTVNFGVISKGVHQRFSGRSPIACCDPHAGFRIGHLLDGEDAWYDLDVMDLDTLGDLLRLAMSHAEFRAMDRLRTDADLFAWYADYPLLSLEEARIRLVLATLLADQERTAGEVRGFRAFCRAQRFSAAETAMHLSACLPSGRP